MTGGVPRSVDHDTEGCHIINVGGPDQHENGTRCCRRRRLLQCAASSANCRCRRVATLTVNRRPRRSGRSLANRHAPTCLSRVPTHSRAPPFARLRSTRTWMVTRGRFSLARSTRAVEIAFDAPAGPAGRDWRSMVWVGLRLRRAGRHASARTSSHDTHLNRKRAASGFTAHRATGRDRHRRRPGRACCLPAVGRRSQRPPRANAAQQSPPGRAWRCSISRCPRLFPPAPYLAAAQAAAMGAADVQRRRRTRRRWTAFDARSFRTEGDNARKMRFDLQLPSLVAGHATAAVASGAQPQPICARPVSRARRSLHRGRLQRRAAWPECCLAATTWPNSGTRRTFVAPIRSRPANLSRVANARSFFYFATQPHADSHMHRRARRTPPVFPRRSGPPL